MTDFEKQLAHSTQQAMTPGWYAYAQNSVGTLETAKSTASMFQGLRAAVGVNLKASKYRPAPHELGELK